MYLLISFITCKQLGASLTLIVLLKDLLSHRNRCIILKNDDVPHLLFQALIEPIMAGPSIQQEHENISLVLQPDRAIYAGKSSIVHIYAACI